RPWGARSSSSSVSFLSGWKFGVEHLVDHLDLLLEAAGDEPPEQADPVSSFSDCSRRLVCRSLAFSLHDQRLLSASGALPSGGVPRPVSSLLCAAVFFSLCLRPGICYSAPNICSSPPSWPDRQASRPISQGTGRDHGPRCGRGCRRAGYSGRLQAMRCRHSLTSPTPGTWPAFFALRPRGALPLTVISRPASATFRSSCSRTMSTQRAIHSLQITALLLLSAGAATMSLVCRLLLPQKLQTTLWSSLTAVSAGGATVASRAARNRAGITTRSLQTLQHRPLLTGSAGWPNSVYRRKQIEHCLLLSSLMLRSSSAASAWCGGRPFGRAKSRLLPAPP